MAGLIGSDAVLTGNRGHGVAVDAVRAHFGEFFGQSSRFGQAEVARTLIPQHHGEEDAHAATVEVGHHLADGGDSAGHVAEVIELAAVIDADVGIGVPDEDGVDTSVAFIEIIEVAVDGVFAGGGIEEVAVFDHHLGLHETALGPLEFGPVVFGTVVADAFEILHAPALHVGEPAGEFGGGARAFEVVALWGHAGILGDEDDGGQKDGDGDGEGGAHVGPGQSQGYRISKNLSRG